jgi:hypothetical protein
VDQGPSKSRVLLARLTLGLMVAFVLAGLLLHGVSAEVLARIWSNVIERPDGPMAFRFYLQPVMATIAALHDGVLDARTGRTPYFWTVINDPSKRTNRLNEGLVATSRVLLLGLGMDLIYQFTVIDTFLPAEAVIVAVLLAFVPYLLLRGPVARIARWWLARQSAGAKR